MAAPTSLSRRALLAAAIAGTAGAASALPSSALSGWDAYTDVLVIGAGVAGVCAALQARMASAAGSFITVCTARPAPRIAPPMLITAAHTNTWLDRVKVRDGKLKKVA